MKLQANTRLQATDLEKSLLVDRQFEQIGDVLSKVQRKVFKCGANLAAYKEQLMEFLPVYAKSIEKRDLPGALQASKKLLSAITPKADPALNKLVRKNRKLADAVSEINLAVEDLSSECYRILYNSSTAVLTDRNFEQTLFTANEVLPECLQVLEKLLAEQSASTLSASSRLVLTAGSSDVYLAEDGKTWGDYHDAGMWDKKTAEAHAKRHLAAQVDQDPSGLYLVKRKLPSKKPTRRVRYPMLRND